MSLVVLLQFLTAVFVGCGAISNEANDGSKFLGVFVFEADEASDAVSLATVALHCTAEARCRILRVEFRDADTGVEVVGTLLKKSGGDVIEPKCFEYLNAQLDEHDRASVIVKVTFELAGKKWYSCSLRNSEAARLGRVFPHNDLANLTMYVNSAAALGIDELQCSVNETDVKISAVTSVPVGNEEFVSAVELKLDDSFSAGDRLFVKLRQGKQAAWFATTKLFYQFSVGTTQYDQIVRPVLVDHGKNSVRLSLYNEADYRKSPALLQKVMLNGEDVTHKVVLPTGPLPPDLHNYDEDLRDAVVGVSSKEPAERHKYEIQFKRLPPLRSKEIPAGYFDVQSFSFETQVNVPYAIGSDNGWGFPGAACIFQGGLRPRPELSELIERFTSVYNADPSIPAYTCASSGMHPDRLIQMASCGDLLVTGESAIPEDEWETLGRSDRYFQSLEQVNAVPGAWIASVVSENRQGWTSPEDLEWLAWACIASGSHGLWLTPPDRGDEKMMDACRQAAQEIRDDVMKLKPWSGISFPVELPIKCNQTGIRIKSLLCGCDTLLVFIFNEWSSRSAFQGSEPFNAVMRQNVELKFALPENWEHISVAHPCTESPVALDRNGNDVVVLKMSQLSNVQLLVISSSDEPVDLKTLERKDEEMPFVIESPTVINMGVIRTNSEHTAEFKIRSLNDSVMRFKADNVSHQNSKSGEFSVGSQNEVELRPGETQTIAIAYTAPGTIGSSITNIHFRSGKESFNVYVAGEIQEPLELSHSVVDFGLVAVGSTSEPKIINITSIQKKFRLGTVESSSATVVDLNPSESAGILSFCVHPKKTGTFSAEVYIDVFVGDDIEPIRKTLTLYGEARESVFAAPSTVSHLIGSKSIEYSICLRHIGGELIEIISIEGSRHIKAEYPKGRTQKEFPVKLTIAPEILSETNPVLRIDGTSDSGEAFSIKVPIEVTSISPQNRLDE